MHFLVFYTVYPSSHMFPPQTSKISQQLCPGTIHGTGLLVALLRLLRCDVLGMLHLVSRPCEFISVPEIQKTCPKKQKAEILIFKNCWQYLQNLPTNSEELQKLPPAPPSHHPRPHQCTFSRHGRQPSPRPSFVSALHQRTFWSTWRSRKMNLVPENGGFVPQNSRSNGR